MKLRVRLPPTRNQRSRHLSTLVANLAAAQWWLWGLDKLLPDRIMVGILLSAGFVVLWGTYALENYKRAEGP